MKRGIQAYRELRERQRSQLGRGRNRWKVSVGFYRKTRSYGKIIHSCADGLPHTLCYAISTMTGGKVQKDPLADCFISGFPSGQMHVIPSPVADTLRHSAACRARGPLEDGASVVFKDGAFLFQDGQR